MKVVRTADALSNSICRKPELASIFENMVAFSNDANDCSTEDSKCLSLHTALFNFGMLLSMFPALWIIWGIVLSLYLYSDLNFCLLVLRSLSNRLSQDIVSLPTKDYRSPLITNTSSCVSLSLCLRFAWNLPSTFSGVWLGPLSVVLELCNGPSRASLHQLQYLFWIVLDVRLGLSLLPMVILLNWLCLHLHLLFQEICHPHSLCWLFPQFSLCDTLLENVLS